MRKKEFPKETISARVEGYLIKALHTLSIQTQLTKSDLIELAILEFVCKLEKTLVFNGVDLIEIAKISKIRKLRNMTKVIRTEEKSKTLFMSRVETDMLIYIANKKDIHSIIKLLNIYRKEANLYEDKKPYEEINKLIILLEEKKNDNIDYLSILREKLLDSRRIALQIDNRINKGGK